MPSSYTAHVEIDPHALLLTRAQAARLLGVSPNTIGNMARRGELQWVVVAGAKKIRRRDVEAIVNGKPAIASS